MQKTEENPGTIKNENVIQTNVIFDNYDFSETEITSITYQDCYKL